MFAGADLQLKLMNWKKNFAKKKKKKDEFNEIYTKK